MTNKNVVIIDYGSGNLRSVEKAYQNIIMEHNLSFDVTVSSETQAVKNASHIVLPGQGAYQDCMKGLQDVPDMIETLVGEVLGQKKPFLGICVGMQLLMEKGFEHGEHDGLGWISGQVVPIQPADPSLKIPHMGWNVVNCEKSHPVIKNQKNSPHFYFVHSFMVELKDNNNVMGTAVYGDVTIPAIIAKDNMIGIQCHPEKSQGAGLQFLSDFLHWNP